MWDIIMFNVSEKISPVGTIYTFISKDIKDEIIVEVNKNTLTGIAKLKK